MKFTINTSPLSIISEKLWDWFDINPHVCPKYIIMSPKTERFIANNEEHFYTTGDTHVSYYHRIPIALCNNLKFGEIEFV